MVEGVENGHVQLRIRNYLYIRPLTLLTSLEYILQPQTGRKGIRNDGFSTANNGSTQLHTQV